MDPPQEQQGGPTLPRPVHPRGSVNFFHGRLGNLSGDCGSVVCLSLRGLVVQFPVDVTLSKT